MYAICYTYSEEQYGRMNGNWRVLKSSCIDRLLCNLSSRLFYMNIVAQIF